MNTTIRNCTIDDAMEYILDFLSDVSSKRNSFSNYGYDFFIRNVITFYVREREGMSSHVVDEQQTNRVAFLFPVFMDAAWLLCRKGIIRPSVATLDGQGVANNQGFSLTAIGQDWLTRRQETPTFPSDPSRFGALIEQFRDMLGKGFYQRAQEALGCYSFGNYLAACVMAGAATESILLRIAIAKAGGDEKQVLRDYKGTSGTQKIENRITQPLKKPLADPFKDLTALIGYWRNEAAHGEESDISETEAYIAITKLLRFAEFSRRNWTQLTQLSSNPTDN